MADNDTVLAQMMEMSKQINQISNAVVESDVKREGLAEALKHHMASEERVQKQIADVVTELKDAIAAINTAEHGKHHQFIDEYIEKEKARKEFWCGVKANIATGSIWSLVVALAGVCWFAFKEWLKTFQG